MNNEQRLLILRLSQSNMNEYGDEVVSNPTTAEGWKEIAASYSSRWNFHHVLGALDGKHIRIRCPANGGSKFCNCKGYHSIVLLALVDANHRFTWVQVGAPVAASDAQLWNESTLRDAVFANSIDISQQEPLPVLKRPVPYFIIGDNAFAHNEWMMKSFAAAPLEQDEWVFNHRLSHGRRCVENAFGILANRWGCLLTTLHQEPQNVEIMVNARIKLPNMLRTAGTDNAGVGIRNSPHL